MLFNSVFASARFAVSALIFVYVDGSGAAVFVIPRVDNKLAILYHGE
jgi:hypothetical protein